MVNNNTQMTETDTLKCPDCGQCMVRTNDNDPLADREKYKCTNCGNTHTIYH